MGIEPTTPCLQSRCSSQLSYVPAARPGGHGCRRYRVRRDGPGGHGRRDERGMVESGYTLDPAFRRRGLASRAAAAWFDWAARRGARTARIQAVAENSTSLAVARRLGLVTVGEEWDEDDQVTEQV